MYTPEEILDLKRIADEAVKLFEPGCTKYWDSKDALADAVKAFAKANRFTVGLHGKSFFCSRARESPAHQKRRESKIVPPEKRRKTHSNRCDCGFVIRFTESYRKMPGTSPIAVRVTESSSFMHTNGCRPGPEQLRHSNMAAGYYSKMILAHENIHELFDLMRNSDSFVSVKTLREALKPMVPDDFPLTAIFLCNLRTKILAMLSKGGDFVPKSTKKSDQADEDDSDSNSNDGMPTDFGDTDSVDAELEALGGESMKVTANNPDAPTEVLQQASASARTTSRRSEPGRARLPITSKRGGTAPKGQPQRNKENHKRSTSHGRERLNYRNYMDLCIDLWDLIQDREDINYFSGALSKLVELARSKETHNELDFEVLDSYLSNCAAHGESSDIASPTSPNGDKKRPALTNRTRNRPGLI